MTATKPQTLAEALGDELTRRRLSQREAAEQIGVSQATLSKWVLGEYQPGVEHFRAIARFLRVPVGEVQRLHEAQDRPRPMQTKRRLDAIEARLGRIERAVDRLVELEEARAGR